MAVSDEFHVAVAILRRDDGCVLVAERPAWRHAGGGLEFPGGKLDPDEPVADALVRELDEELGVRALHWAPLMRIRHEYPDRGVVLHVHTVDEWAGEPVGAEDQAVEWLPVARLDAERFPAANRPIVGALQLPSRYLITPSVEESEFDAIVAGLEAAIEGGCRLLQLREPGWSADAWARLLERASDIAGRTGQNVNLIANTGDPAWLDRYPAIAGMHLTSRAMLEFQDRPIARTRYLSCACHGRDEIRHAERLGADFAVVGHVKPTPSHRGREALGWNGLEQLSAETVLPIYAVGGMTVADIERARHHGAVGIAAIRGTWPGG